MGKLSSIAIHKWGFYFITTLCVVVLLAFQNCGKVKFSAPRGQAVVPQSCGTITMSPQNGIYPPTAVTFEVVPANGVSITSLSWTFVKGNTTVYTSNTNPVVHTFNAPNEGAGDYTATAVFIKSDGNGCELAQSFQVLVGDLCASPSGISGPAIGYVGEETSPFSVNTEACFTGITVWDMDGDGNAEYTVPADEQVTHIYVVPGTYTVRGTVINSDDNSQTILTHTIEIRNKSCVNPFTSQSVAHGQSVEFAKQSTQCGGQPCSKIQKTCNNGSWSGDASFTQDPATCPVSQSCATCGNGAINPPTCDQCPSGQSLVNGQCSTPQPPQSCTFNGQTVAHGASVTAYQSSSVGFGGTCVSETRTCNNGTLSGSYAYVSCTVGSAASCSLPWGGTIAHGQSVTAYSSSQVACGQSCASEARSCNNGSLSGSYSNASCSVAACPVNGACGSANGGSFPSAPTSNLCSSGSQGEVGGSGPWNWTCYGSNGGSNASCSASKQGFPIASCGFGLYSSNWSADAGQPTSGYNSCEWAGSISMGSSNQVYAVFHIADYYDTSGPYGIHRINNPGDWSITASGCTISTIVDPKNPQKKMTNYCKAGTASYGGSPITWSATITARNTKTGEVRVHPIKATFKPTLNGASGSAAAAGGGSSPVPDGSGVGGMGGAGGGGVHDTTQLQ